MVGHTAAVPGKVQIERAVTQERHAAVTIVNSAPKHRCIFPEIAIDYSRAAATNIEYTSTTVIRVRTMGMASGNGKTVQHRALVGSAAGHYMVAVFPPRGVVQYIEQCARVYDIGVIAIKVTAQHSCVFFRVSLVWVRLTEAGVAAFNSQAAFELERRCPVAGRDPSSLVGFIDALSHPNLVSA
jgi:hypothetical protein